MPMMLNNNITKNTDKPDTEASDNEEKKEVYILGRASGDGPPEKAEQWAEGPKMEPKA